MRGNDTLISLLPIPYLAMELNNQELSNITSSHVQRPIGMAMIAFKVTLII
jgi:hypothetical protein